jgi:hypothetical protein
MNWELVFKVANLSVIPAWFLLVFLPKHPITKWVSHSYLYPILLGVFYLYMLVTSFGGDGGLDSLANLKLSFQRDEILTLGWVHYLVFDLFVGAWITRDANVNFIRHLLIIPSLLLTLFVGPVGLLSYVFIRWYYTRETTL